MSLENARNLLYDKSASFRCDGIGLVHSPGSAAANPQSPKVQ